MDGYGWMVRGRDLHLRGRLDEAEVSYREAINLGREDSWLLLAHLLWAQPGRLHDELAAYRAAMEVEDLEERAVAAQTLGYTLAFVCGDLVAARRCLDFAEANGSVDVRRQASRGLMFLDVREGKTADAAVRINRLASPQMSSVSDEAADRIAAGVVWMARWLGWYRFQQMLVRGLRRFWGVVSQSRRTRVVDWRAKKLGGHPLPRLAFGGEP